jgi:hypothetical protein
VSASDLDLQAIRERAESLLNPLAVWSVGATDPRMTLARDVLALADEVERLTAERQR